MTLFSGVDMWDFLPWATHQGCYHPYLWNGPAQIILFNPQNVSFRQIFSWERREQAGVSLRSAPVNSFIRTSRKALVGLLGNSVIGSTVWAKPVCGLLLQRLNPYGRKHVGEVIRYNGILGFDWTDSKSTCIDKTTMVVTRTLCSLW